MGEDCWSRGLQSAVLLLSAEAECQPSVAPPWVDGLRIAPPAGQGNRRLHALPRGAGRSSVDGLACSSHPRRARSSSIRAWGSSPASGRCRYCGSCPAAGPADRAAAPALAPSADRSPSDQSLNASCNKYGHGANPVQQRHELRLRRAATTLNHSRAALLQLTSKGRVDGQGRS